MVGYPSGDPVNDPLGELLALQRCQLLASSSDYIRPGNLGRLVIVIDANDGDIVDVRVREQKRLELGGRDLEALWGGGGVSRISGVRGGKSATYCT